MPRSAGTYTPPASSWNPAVNNASATLADWNSLLTDLSNALTQSMSLDGQSTPTGNLPMGGFKLTGLAAGSATGNSLRWEQLFDQGAETTIASAATTDIGAQNTNFLQVTGTTTITSFGTNYKGPRFLRFAGILTLTHNATTLILPGAANITTAADDSCIAVPIGGGTGWKVLAYQRADGSLITTLPVTGGGTGATTVLGARAALEVEPAILPITATVAANAMTITLNPCVINFRSTTLASGVTTAVTVAAAITLVIPNTATLGTVNAVLSRLVPVVINNAGTAELAVVNMAGGSNLDETTLISTTAISAAASSSSTFYSTTGRASVAFRVGGVIESTQATAGTWATAPSLVQGKGGQSMAAMQSLGFGQTWQAMGGARVVSTTYYNTTGRPIFVSASIASNTAAASIQGTVNGVTFNGSYSNVSGVYLFIAFAVPPGGSYSLTLSLGTPTAYQWNELR